MKKILIVEDDELLLGVMSEQFEEHGYKVITAVDGSDGLQKFLTEQPDLAIVDVIMPQKSGIEMLEAIHARNPEDKTPVIILTNTNEGETMAAAISQKVIGYLLKSEQALAHIVEFVEKKLSTQ